MGGAQMTRAPVTAEIPARCACAWRAAPGGWERAGPRRGSCSPCAVLAGARALMLVRPRTAGGLWRVTDYDRWRAHLRDGGAEPPAMTARGYVAAAALRKALALGGNGETERT
jgi:hypothetical protein